MATKTERTERENMERVQKAYSMIAKACDEEMARARETGNAEHLNAWYHTKADNAKGHAMATERGLKLFPDFFGEIVLQPKGGGGR